jgi:hypothetical protein
MNKREAQQASATLAVTAAVGTGHLMALLYAASQLNGGIKYVLRGFAVFQTLNLLAVTVGQGAAIYVSKAAPDESTEQVVGTRDFLTRPL